MRPTSYLAHAAPSTTSSSAAAVATALGKTKTRLSPQQSSFTSLTPSHLRHGGPQAAEQLMRLGRVFVPVTYLPGSSGYQTAQTPGVSPALRRSRRYEPYGSLLQMYMERGFTDLDALLFHPEAPSPMELLLSVLRHRTACLQLTQKALTATISRPRHTSSAGAASYTLQTVYHILKNHCPYLYDTASVRVLLCQALLCERLFSDAIELLQGMPDSWITPGLWQVVMEAAADGKVPHSPLLWKLLTLSPAKTPGEGRVVRTGQRVPEQLRRGMSARAAEVVSRSFVNRGESMDEAAKAHGMHQNSDTVTFSSFEVRPLSIVQITRGGNQLEWCHLSTSEVGYAEQHYRALRNLRGWGHGVLRLGKGDHLMEGVVYGLDAFLASRLMLRANVSFFGQASPLIALHILRRYIRTCHALRKTSARSSVVKGTGSDGTSELGTNSDWLKYHQPSSTSGSPGVSTSDTQASDIEDFIHPSPFLLFFKVVRETRDVLPGGGGTLASAGHSGTSGGVPTAGLPMIHWELVWRYFQTLNRECPNWHTIIPEKAGDLSQYVIDVLCRGADPWMTLNVARAVSSRHIVDGLDMSLWLLHRLDPSHHMEEARDVTRKVFRWLLTDVGVHLLPQLHHNLIPAARVLVRLGLQDELRQLYNGVLDNVYLFAEDFRAEFLHVMMDLVCPSCSSILSAQDVYAERVCSICLTIIPAKDAGSLPSFQLSSEHISRLREKRKVVRLSERKRLHESICCWSKRGENSRETAAGATNVGKHAAPPVFPPLDASSVFKKEILSDTAPLLPGVPVAARNVLLLPGGGGADGAGSCVSEGGGPSASFDVYAAMEESSHRLQLQEAARRYALAQRGVVLPARHSAAFPSPVLSTSSVSTSSAHFSPEKQRQGFMIPSMCVDGPWTCVWCHEQNTGWGSRTQCGACGAETGPSALWRHFAYATSTGDIMEEVRARVANSAERPVDAVVAGYLLMVYRRTFLLRATPHDAERIEQLIQRLCQLHERVLAGYTYMRFVPAHARSKGSTLFALAHLFGCTDAAYAGLTTQQLRRDEDTFFQTIFTPATCKVCFGQHAWKACPIITRDFSTTKRQSITMSPKEKQDAVLQQLRQAVEAAVQHGAESSRLVVGAYTAFVKSPYRELFSETHSRDVNRLSMLLSRYQQFRRAAFVLCHIPLHLRDDGAYMAMVPYFNVPVEDARELLRKRSPLGVADGTHPNFVQVAVTCCMCLDERHASFECPRLLKWIGEIEELSASQKNGSATSGALVDVVAAQELFKRLRAQVDGWTSAGPERLHAFYRFLLQRIDDFQKDPYDTLQTDGDEHGHRQVDSCVVGSSLNMLQLRRLDMDDPIVYAINKAISKLALAKQEKSAYRLYARSPVVFVSSGVTSTMLRMAGYSEKGIRTLSHNHVDGSGSSQTSLSSSLSASDESSTLGVSTEGARSAAVPMRNCCLLCFDSEHTYFDCPELIAQPTTAAKLEYVVVHVGGIRSVLDGVRAAAAYVYHTYNLGQLTSDLLRAHPSLVRSLLRLVRRCFACGLVGSGVRILRRLPVEMVPPISPYTDLWRAAGLGEEVVISRRAQLQALFAAEGLEPRIETPPARQTYSNRFVSALSHVLHDDLCRHCYQHGHSLATCSVFHAEVSFGRDYVAAYRMSMMSEQLDDDWRDAYLLKLVDFFLMHKVLMPYHIVGVTNALNAIAAMWSFRGEPGIAIRHLLNIPPAYRRRQAFAYILQAVGVPVDEAKRVLANVYFSPSELSSSNKPSGSSASASASASAGSGSGSGAESGSAVAQHLLMPKPAIRDVAMTAVFNQFPDALAALEGSEGRMEAIRRRNATQKITKGSKAEGGNMKTTSVGGAARMAESSLGEEPSVPSVSLSRRPVQSGDITTVRENFDPVLTELELAVGMKLGSRHVLFTSAVDILAAVVAPKETEGGSGKVQQPAVTTTVVVPPQAASPPPSENPASKLSPESTVAIPRSDACGHPHTREEPEIVTVFSGETAGGGGSGRGSHQRWGVGSDGLKPSSSPSNSPGGDHEKYSSSQHFQTQQHYTQKGRYHERQRRRQRERDVGSNGNHARKR